MLLLIDKGKARYYKNLGIINLGNFFFLQFHIYVHIHIYIRLDAMTNKISKLN